MMDERKAIGKATEEAIIPVAPNLSDLGESCASLRDDVFDRALEQCAKLWHKRILA
jgi:hypothetical protein